MRFWGLCERGGVDERAGWLEVSLSCAWTIGAYHELGVLGPRVGVEGHEEVLFPHRLLGGAWRGSRGGRG